MCKDGGRPGDSPQGKDRYKVRKGGIFSVLMPGCVIPRAGGGKRVGSDVNFLSGTNEESNFRDLSSLIVQLGEISRFATVMFQDLYNDAVVTGDRVDAVSERVRTNLHAGLSYIEHQLVVDEEPLGLYEERLETIQVDTPGAPENLFTPESLPAALADRCRVHMDPRQSFALVDHLSVREVAPGLWVDSQSDEFKPAALSVSNPNCFNEQFIESLKTKAQRERAAQRAKRKSRKVGRARKNSVKGENKARVRRVRKKRRGGMRDVIGVADDEEDAETAFKKMDKQGRGAIEYGEVKQAFANLGEQMSDDQMLAAMSRMNANAGTDGMVRAARLLLYFRRLSLSGTAS